MCAAPTLRPAEDNGRRRAKDETVRAKDQGPRTRDQRLRIKSKRQRIKYKEERAKDCGEAKRSEQKPTQLTLGVLKVLVGFPWVNINLGRAAGLYVIYYPHVSRLTRVLFIT